LTGKEAWKILIEGRGIFRFDDGLVEENVLQLNPSLPKMEHVLCREIDLIRSGNFHKTSLDTESNIAAKNYDPN
jgi:hypothetical protein